MLIILPERLGYGKLALDAHTHSQFCSVLFLKAV